MKYNETDSERQGQKETDTRQMHREIDKRDYIRAEKSVTFASVTVKNAAKFD